ncbi:barstar family protein [Jatrophihabitans sp.]|uniref:barstar family protein n=1 Tax=Jatrophihabitans sp. TaxID=1932789 RepID=UPI0030C71925|nr:hypothetical protein [Jatrophihabitans sp.]
MAAWEPDDSLAHRLDYRLAANTFVTMFWQPSLLDETTTWLRDHDYDVVIVDASGWAAPADMHQALADALDFPDYYGNNLHALNDCLRDVAAGDYGVGGAATGLVLTIRNYETFAAEQAQTAQALLDIFAVQARAAALIGRRMMCLVQSNNPKLTFGPVGAMPVVWNEAEWLDSKRQP